MKKSLFAVAALTALAGTAQAQSSVSVYGILDAGYIGANQKGTGSSISTNSQTSAIGQSAESTSRLGFKGNEDIGGGLSAFFTVEVGLTPTGGAVTTASTWNNRQSFVGLKKQGIGQFAFGRQYTPIYEEASKTDPTGKPYWTVPSKTTPHLPGHLSNQRPIYHLPESACCKDRLQDDLAKLISIYPLSLPCNYRKALPKQFLSDRQKQLFQISLSVFSAEKPCARQRPAIT